MEHEYFCTPTQAAQALLHALMKPSQMRSETSSKTKISVHIQFSLDCGQRRYISIEYKYKQIREK